MHKIRHSYMVIAFCARKRFYCLIPGFTYKPIKRTLYQINCTLLPFV